MDGTRCSRIDGEAARSIVVAPATVNSPLCWRSPSAPAAAAKLEQLPLVAGEATRARLQHQIDVVLVQQQRDQRGPRCARSLQGGGGAHPHPLLARDSSLRCSHHPTQSWSAALLLSQSPSNVPKGTVSAEVRPAVAIPYRDVLSTRFRGAGAGGVHPLSASAWSLPSQTSFLFYQLHVIKGIQQK